MQISMSGKIGHGHQKYTVDPCHYDSNLNIATKNTLWIYVLRDSNLNIAMRHTLWIYAKGQSEYTPM
jgi:hypothetical protein